MSNIKNEIVEAIKKTADLSEFDRDTVELLIYFEGVVESAQYLVKTKGAKQIILKEIYQNRFGVELSKKVIEKRILEGDVKMTDEVKELVRDYFLAKLPKPVFLQYFEPVVKENPSLLTIEKYMEDKHVDFLVAEDLDALSIILDVTLERIRQLIKIGNYQYKKKVSAEVKNKQAADDFVENLKASGYVEYRPNYWVNEKAEVFKRSTNNIKKQPLITRENNKGMKYYSVSMEGGQVFAHRMLAELFVPNPNGYKYVMAIDGNHMNLEVSNFRWSPYAAYTRVVRNLGDEADQTWLTFIIDNFVPKLTIGALARVIGLIADEKDAFMDNKYKSVAIENTIRKYSDKENNLFPIFVLSDDGNSTTVSLNYDFLDEIKK